jgi:sterol desaturase/sphingolipid hydroxylase (fatty acid hydroxylase superfamily)
MKSALPPPPPPPPSPPSGGASRSRLAPPPPRPEHGRGRGRTGWRMVRWFHVVAIAVAIVTSLIFGYGEAGGVVALFIIIVPFEKMFRRHDQRIRRPGLRTDLTYAIVSPVLNVAGVVVGVGLALLFFPLFLPALLLRPLVLGQPGWLIAVEAILLLDILIYWTHRLGHEVGFFWRFHSIHHSSEKMDWISGIRAHPFDGVIIAVPAVFLIVAGFNIEVVGIAAVVQAVLGLTAHANVRWRLRPLHRIVMTPEFHHWHHANHPESIHTNYSVFLPVWDMVWGTYYMPSDQRPQVYGQSENTPPSVPAQMLVPFSKPMRERYPFPPTWRARLRRLVPFRRRRVAAS